MAWPENQITLTGDGSADTGGDVLVYLEDGAATCDVTLPSVVCGHMVVVTKVGGTQTGTVTCQGSDTYQGGGTSVAVPPDSTVIVKSDTALWHVVLNPLPAPASTGDLLTAASGAWTSTASPIPAAGTAGNIIEDSGTAWTSAAVTTGMPGDVVVTANISAADYEIPVGTGIVGVATGDATDTYRVKLPAAEAGGVPVGTKILIRNMDAVNAVKVQITAPDVLEAVDNATITLSALGAVTHSGVELFLAVIDAHKGYWYVDHWLVQ